MKMKRYIAALVFILAAGVLAGCGGDEHRGPRPPKMNAPEVKVIKKHRHGQPDGAAQPKPKKSQQPQPAKPQQPENPQPQPYKLK